MKNRYSVISNDEASRLTGQRGLPELGWSIVKKLDDGKFEWIANDGGEPEDQTFVRDLDWIPCWFNQFEAELSDLQESYRRLEEEKLALEWENGELKSELKAMREELSHLKPRR